MISVLHIEDSLLFQEIVAEEFEFSEQSFEVRHAETLRSALEILASWDPDVVLTDLWLPDSEGRATYETVRAHATRSRLVVLTGSDRMLLDEMLGTVPDPVLPKDDVTQIPALVIALASEPRAAHSEN